VVQNGLIVYHAGLGRDGSAARGER
jgi:hypothetical protein